MALGVDDPVWAKILVNWCQDTVRCGRCQTEYREIDNIGRLKCWQHPGELQDRQAREPEYTCCHSKDWFQPASGKTGCVRADHIPEPEIRAYTERDDVPVPYKYAHRFLPVIVDKQLVPFSRMTKEQVDRQTLVFRRYDEQQALDKKMKLSGPPLTDAQRKQVFANMPGQVEFLVEYTEQLKQQAEEDRWK
jgi:hypothetical protein